MDTFSIFMPNYFVYLGILFIVTAFIALVGVLVIRVMPEWKPANNFWLYVFNACMMGFTVTVSCFAILWTCGNSIMWIVILDFLLYLLWLKNKNSIKNHITINYKIILICFLIIVFIYSLLYFMFFVYSGGATNGDHVLYSDFMQHIISNHNENICDIHNNIAQSYHWGDIWITAIAFLLYDYNGVYTLLLITYPLFLFLCCIGIIAIIKAFDSSAKWYLVVMLIVIFLFFQEIVALNRGWMHWGRSLFGMPKFYLVSAYLLWGSVFLSIKNYENAFFVLILLIPMYSVVSAGILTFLFLIGICSKHFRLSVFSIIVAFTFILFYYFQKDTGVIKMDVPSTIPADNLQTIATNSIKTALRTISMLFISVTTMLYLYKTGLKTDKLISEYVFVLLSYIVSVIVAVSFGLYMEKYIGYDSTQMGWNYLETSIRIIVFILFLDIVCVLFRYCRKNTIACLVVAAIFFPLQNYVSGDINWFFWKANIDDETRQAYLTLKNEFNGKEKIAFGYIDTYDYCTDETAWFSPFVSIPMKKIFQVTPHGYYYPYCLSIEDEYLNGLISPAVKRGIHYSDLNQFIISGRGGVNEFIDEKKIEYIIVFEKAELPEKLFRRCKKITECHGDVVYKIVAD